MSVFTLGHRLGSRPLASAAECMAPSSDPYARQVSTHAWDGHTTEWALTTGRRVFSMEEQQPEGGTQ